MELTSRANLQVRGLNSGCGQEFAQRLAAVGLLPSATHERVRNVLGSPTADGDAMWDVRAVAHELDVLLCAIPDLAELPGRFLFAVDGGGGDVAALAADVCLYPLRSDSIALLLAGTDSGVRVAPGEAARAAVAAAEAFLTERGRQGSLAWRLTELDNGVQAIAGKVLAVRDAVWSPPEPVPARPLPTHAQVGELFRQYGRITVGVGAPLGRLSPEQVDIIAAASGTAGELRLTPWRTIVLPGLPADEADRWLSDLGAHGLVVDREQGRTGVTSCTGRPGCAKALADVRNDAERAMRRPIGGELPVHWVGCTRRCGRPQGPVVEVLATEAGYEIGLDGRTYATEADIDQVSAALDVARRKE
ncbi:precorrin-3B synthase [Parasphingorhabdus pacifica]